MTTWTTISNAAVAVGGIPSSTTVTALRDNPAAMAETSSGAPVVFAGWHPVDKVTIGDGKAGLIYDYSITGNVASVVTSDFVDGYEYRIICHSLQSDSAANNVRLGIEAYFETTAAYRRLCYTSESTPTNYFGCDVNIVTPRLASRTHLTIGNGYVNGNIALAEDSTSYIATEQKLLRARIIFSNGNIQAGKIWMFRRREYASSP